MRDIITTPRKVDFQKYEDDFQCALLGALGYSNRFIQQETRFSYGKISYRLKKAHVRRLDYRDGLSEASSLVNRFVAPLLGKDFRKHLNNNRKGK